MKDGLLMLKPNVKKSKQYFVLPVPLLTPFFHVSFWITMIWSVSIRKDKSQRKEKDRSTMEDMFESKLRRMWVKAGEALISAAKEQEEMNVMLC